MLNVLRLNPFRSSGATPTPITPTPAEDSLDDTIEHMNETAGKSPLRQSPRKRKTTEDGEPPYSPAKRRSGDRQAQATPGPVTAASEQPPASRLRSRKSNPLRHSFDRNKPFELPAEETEDPVPQLKGSQKPVHKALRRLGRRAADPSPLKGRGVIEIPMTGRRSS